MFQFNQDFDNRFDLDFDLLYVQYRPAWQGYEKPM